MHIDVALCDRADAARASTNACWDLANLPGIKRHLTIEEVRNAKIPVHKVGAQTGHTVANFSAYHKEFTDPRLGPLFGVLEFVAEAPSQNIADGGDSGAPVVSRAQGSEGALVGVLFAASVTDDGIRERIFVIPFEAIRDVFDVDVAPV